jgi:N-acetylmuramic acid 6-phosphate etherase
MTERLPATESVDARTAAIDRLDGEARVRLLLESQVEAAAAAAGAAPAIARAADLVAGALRAGRRVVYLGAGTSGRLGVLDAAELPPTFGLDPEQVQGRIAGGDAALRGAIEGAEDDAAAGERSVDDLGAGDVAIGISASGGAPFVCGAVAAARARGVATVAIVNVPDARLAALADVAIVVATGAEPIAGSTRMRAGTAQKIVLSVLSTAAMIALGKTYRNRMVDLVATNAKLRNRAERLVREFAGAEADAAALLAAAGGRVKTAIVMARRGVARDDAEELLAAAGGRLAAVIENA